MFCVSHLIVIESPTGYFEAEPFNVSLSRCPRVAGAESLKFPRAEGPLFATEV